MRQLLILSVMVLLVSCVETADQVVYRKYRGETMGTYYQVSTPCDFGGKAVLDSALVALNMELSTYIPESLISRFNRSGTGDTLVVSYPAGGDRHHWHMLRNLDASQLVYEQSTGAFNPCVMPLVNYWGFGYTEKKPVEEVDSSLVDSLVGLTDFGQLSWWHSDSLFFMKKMREGLALDLSAIAKGYGVDYLAEMLEARGCSGYLVDIGGEARAKGRNGKGKIWTTGVNRPREGAEFEDIVAVLELEDASVATSGNYRNFYEVNGRKYSHTINPATGYPERSTLLSVTVVAEECAIADAWATAFMVMGKDRAQRAVEELTGVEAYFIFSDDTGNLQESRSSGFSKYLKN